MRVSKLIIEKILTDSTFSGELAISLGIKQQSVIGLAKRNSEKLTLYQAVLFYRKKGFTDEQIFEELKPQNKQLNIIDELKNIIGNTKTAQIQNEMCSFFTFSEVFNCQLITL